MVAGATGKRRARHLVAPDVRTLDIAAQAISVAHPDPAYADRFGRFQQCIFFCDEANSRFFVGNGVHLQAWHAHDHIVFVAQSLCLGPGQIAADVAYSEPLAGSEHDFEWHATWCDEQFGALERWRVIQNHRSVTHCLEVSGLTKRDRQQ
jgi:hypothetical protein